MKTTLIERLIKFMKDNELSQTDLCAKLGVKSQNFTAWQNGERTIPDKHLVNIIALFPEVDGHWLITGEENPNKTDYEKLKKEYKDRLKEVEDDFEKLRKEVDYRKTQIIELYQQIVKLQKEKEGFIMQTLDANNKDSN